MEPNYQIEGNVIVDFIGHVSAWSINTASRASCGKETASKYDCLNRNDHLAYQTSFDFDKNQHRFKKEQYAENVGARILKKVFVSKMFLFRQKNSEKY